MHFANLPHEKRALVVAEMYSRLVATHRISREFILGDVQDPERSAKAHKEAMELYWFIELNQIYLPETVCEQLDNFASKLRKSVR